ncbi:hypothetical protein B0H13DRAFT_2655245 [Mycena leptocephala]|nr:hypothetical protein B0H13DRAFT_2655245 [Mycena leptocephala]
MCVVKYFCYEGSLTLPSPAYSTSSSPFTQHHPRLFAPRPRQLAFVTYTVTVRVFPCFRWPHTTFRLSPCTPAYAASPSQLLCQPTHALSTIADHAALRDNVLFGRPFEEQRRYRRGRIIEHSCLLPDLRSRADGDLIERPKVIDLSGVWTDKQQANIVRTAYCSADVVEMTTHFPLSMPTSARRSSARPFRASSHFTKCCRDFRAPFTSRRIYTIAIVLTNGQQIPHNFRRWDDSTTWSFFGVLITMIRVLKFAFERNVVQISSQDCLFLLASTAWCYRSRTFSCIT